VNNSLQQHKAINVCRKFCILCETCISKPFSYQQSQNHYCYRGKNSKIQASLYRSAQMIKLPSIFFQNHSIWTDSITHQARLYENAVTVEGKQGYCHQSQVLSQQPMLSVQMVSATAQRSTAKHSQWVQSSHLKEFKIQFLLVAEISLLTIPNVEFWARKISNFVSIYIRFYLSTMGDLIK